MSCYLILPRIMVLTLVTFAASGCAMFSPAPDTHSEITVPHTVTHRGETLGVIAAWYTGSSRNWERIRDANPGVDIKRIRIGQVIQVPLQLVKNNAPLTKTRVEELQRSLERVIADRNLAWREADDAGYTYPVNTIRGCEELPNSLIGLHRCAEKVGSDLNPRARQEARNL